ncbi:MAG: signal peptidase I [Planctomycetota bacterium]
MLRELTSLMLAPRATLAAWHERPRLRDAGLLWLELALAVAATTWLTSLLWNLPARLVLAVGAIPLLALPVVVLLRRLGAPWVIRGAGLRRGRARITLAAGTLMSLLPLAVVMAGMLRTGAIGMLAVLIGGTLAVTLLSVWWHGELVRLTNAAASEPPSTASTEPSSTTTAAISPGRFWGALVAEGAISLALLGALVFGGPAGWLTNIYRVPSISMWPTLVGTNPGGDIILVDRTAWWFTPPARFDVVVIDHPGYESHLVKRIIGLGGETVSIEGGNVWINGEVAVRPEAVQYAQLRRDPVFRYDPARDRAAFVAGLPRATHDDGTPLSEAERAERLEKWPLDEADRVAAWFHAESAIVGANAGADDDPQSQTQTQAQTQAALPSLDWAPAQLVTGASGIQLALDGPQRLVLQRTPTDPALANLRSSHICDDLALQMKLDMVPGGTVLVVMRVTSGDRMAEHVFRLQQLADTSGSLSRQGQGSATLVDADGRVDERISRTYVGPQLLGVAPGPVALRVQNIDGVWDMWIDGRRAPRQALRQPVALRGGTDRVQLEIVAAGPTLIRTMLINTPTHYIDFGQLGSTTGLKVPDGEYLLLGDHPIFTTDSRNWEVQEVVWADGHCDYLSLGAEAPTQLAEVPAPATLPTLPPPDEQPDDFNASEERGVLTWLGVMNAAERDTLLAWSTEPAWQSAVVALYEASQRVPAHVRIVPRPFVRRDEMIGRVEAVIAPLATARVIR